MPLEFLSFHPEAEPHPTPVLFVHGAWHGAWCWEKYFLPYFAKKGFESHAVSLRGHGKSTSDKNLKWTRITDYVDDLENAINKLEWKPILVGHSMGGLIVQKYLEDHTVPGAVLLAPVPTHGVWRTTLKIASRHFYLFIKANLTMSLYPLVGSKKMARELFFSSDMTPEELESYSDQLQDESYLGFLDMLAFNLPNPKKVATNMLVLGAENDTIFSVGEMEKTANAYDAKCEIFPDMAHDMMLEKDWKKVADRIIKWIKKIKNE
jgi:alpha-beta hydrolase superfamily lysophospholipase